MPSLRTTFKPLLTMAAVITLSGAFCVARAESFTVLIYETPADIALRHDVGSAGMAYWQGYNVFAQSLVSAGALRGGTALDVAPVSGQDKPVLSGYFILEAPSLAEAIRLSAAAPVSSSGRIEVRASYPNPTMAANK